MVVKTKIKIDRRSTIAEVLRDLAALKNRPNVNQYAVDENIAFFEACRSLPSYIWWLIKRAPKIDGEKLLEVNDLLPKWDREMHIKLMELESRKFPGLLKPLIRALVHFILNAKTDKEWIITANLGCGGMEAERQIIEMMNKKKFPREIAFIGVDKSHDAHELARENFKNLGSFVSIYDVEKLNGETLGRLLSNEKGKYVIILCKNDIFNLDKEFSQYALDVVFHTLFKHHLSVENKERLDSVCTYLSRYVLEYDGYKSWLYIALPHTITGWADPVFLNATIFSDLRYLTKRQSRDTLKNNEKLSFFSTGTYLKERNDSYAS